MRSVLLVGVSVLALGVSSAVAAPLVDVDDIGTNNSNNITQNAGATSSSITVNQSQDGTGAPDIGLAVGGLNVFIQQTSTNADSTVMVDQADTSALGGGNAASVDQNVGLNFSTVTVTQDGTQNGADIVQNGESQTATVNQFGSTNTAMVAQDVSGNMATIDQNGDNNTASATQILAGGNAVDILQFGDGNTADIVQEGPNNTADIDQGDGADDGNTNTATLAQLGDTGMTTISQLGNTNVAAVDQLGDDGIIIIAQGGDFNIATVTQSSSTPGATVDINQAGFFGTTSVIQN